MPLHIKLQEEDQYIHVTRLKQDIILGKTFRGLMTMRTRSQEGPDTLVLTLERKGAARWTTSWTLLTLIITRMGRRRRRMWVQPSEPLIPNKTSLISGKPG
ncbi:hypothetical protein AVEN_87892-1 [Araneus ventricosus]|uniref:Uncharacterized protein n=1 Tax=Araneus ventricosus TaxID=182803 RepID=A0A4Y2BC13_ARAVE|nr:hypothetical protein AVEN_87892-1 [Araneus ventricosus]